MQQNTPQYYFDFECLTASECSRKSSKRRWAFIFGACPFDCNMVFRAFAISWRRLRSETLKPVAKIFTSIKPVLGSVADCLRASRWSLKEEMDVILWVTGLKITASRSPVKMTGQLDFSSVKICFWPVINTHILTVKQIITNLFRDIAFIVSCFKRSRR